MEKSKEELQRLLQLLDMERNEERRQWRDRFLNTSLEQRVKEGVFREDLFHRLNVAFSKTEALPLFGAMPRPTAKIRPP